MPPSFVYDPSRPDFQDRIYDVYRTLRDRHPVYRNEEQGFWALSRFADVRAAANDPRTFSSEGHSMAVGLLPHIQMMDPPRPGTSTRSSRSSSRSDAPSAATT